MSNAPHVTRTKDGIYYFERWHAGVRQTVAVATVEAKYARIADLASDTSIVERARYLAKEKMDRPPRRLL